MKVVRLGTSFETLPNGRLAHISQWTPEIAKAIAATENLELTDEHWSIINLMRSFYQRYNISPVAKLLKKKIKRHLNPDYANDEYLDTLFPNNVLIQGTRIAGLPVPLLDAEVDTPNRKPAAVKKAVDKVVSEQDVTYFTHEFAFEGRAIQVHPTGNLVDPSQWSEDMAVVLAQKEGIELSDEHWEIIRYIRSYYFKYGITPMVRLLTDYLREVSKETVVNVDYLYTLFPEGPARQGSRIAGLPSPQGCID